MSETAVVNTSPIITLTEVGHIEFIRDAGLYLSDSIIRQALKKTTGEEWP